MGGLIARALLTLKNFKQDLLNLLITQATPHVAPVMPLDRFITGECCYMNVDWPPWSFRLTRILAAAPFRECYRCIHVAAAVADHLHLCLSGFQLRLIMETAVSFLCRWHLDVMAGLVVPRHVGFCALILEDDSLALKVCLNFEILFKISLFLSKILGMSCFSTKSSANTAWGEVELLLFIELLLCFGYCVKGFT